MTTNQETIVHIDDDEINRYAVSKILARIDVRVIGASTATEGWKLLDALPDLVILDVLLPDMNGFDLCRQIKADTRFTMTPVLHMSANFVQTADKVEGLESGADGYLAQPIEPGVLVATVKSLLRIRRLDKERARLIQDLEIERDLRDKFVATLSHDLRNPLASALLAADHLLMHAPACDSKMTKRIVDSIHRADLMIQDLLDVSALRAGQAIPLKLEKTDLREFLLSATREHLALSGNRFRCEIIPDEKIVVSISQRNIRRAVDNLISNAIKYGEPNGPVTLSLTHSADEVFISVHNMGPPIPENDRPALFHYFVRSSDVRKSGKPGWGLGLALVKGVAEAHDGRVELTSLPDQGTTFTMVLPLCRDSSP